MSIISSDAINQARTILEQSQDGLILLGKNPTLDQVSSALSLYLAISVKGKRVSITCPDQMTVEFNHLVGVDKISNSPGNGNNGKNLVISFPYQEGSIEKVSYNIENDTFHLVIEPREGYPQVTQDLIKYSYTGGNTDLVITVGISNYNELENSYSNSQNIFANKQIINIDSNPANQMFGKINLVEHETSSIAELLTKIFSQIGLTIDADTAGNLYSGIVSGSNNFTSDTTSAETFESAAVCLKKGAINKQRTSSQQTQSFSRPQIYNPQRQFTPQPKPSFNQNFSQIPKPAMPQMGYRNQPLRNKPVQQMTQQQNIPPQQPSLQPKQTQNDAPPDWLKPKIYKGTSLL